MERYAYQARDASGQRVSGVLEAESETDLDIRLERMQLCLVHARRSRARATSRRARASAQTLADFAYHLSTVVEAGLPLLQGIDDLAAEPDNPLHGIIVELARRLRGGAQLSEALGDHPHVFPNVMRALIAAGENTGRLDVVLRDLVKYLEWRLALRRQIQSALTYPAVLMSGIAALCVLLLTYVLPNFAGIFAEMGVKLPPLTRGLLAMSAFLRAHGVALVAAIAAGVATFIGVGRTRAGLRFYHLVALRMPILGPLVTMLEMSRFTHNLGILYSAGIPLVEGLRLVNLIVQNVRVREIVDSLHEDLRRGGALADSIRKHDIVPRIVTRMIAIGESSGRLDASLERASAFYDRELPRLIGRNLGVFNTASIVLLGAMIAVVGLSIFQPVYQMLGSING